MNQIHGQVDIYAKAVQSIVDGQTVYTGDLLQRDGLLQRFEYTIELLRKTTKKILESEWVDFDPTPNESIKQWVYAGIITDAESCIRLIKTRNLLSHIYDESEIQKIQEYLFNNINFLLDKKEEFQSYIASK